METLPRGEFFFPQPEHPFWGIRLHNLKAPRQAARITRVAANGKPVRQFYLTQGGRICPWHRLEKRQPWQLVVRVPWRSGEAVSLTIETEGSPADGPAWSGPVGTAPPAGGFEQAGLPFFTSVVLSEDAGLDRTTEPVHLSLCFFGDQVRPDCADLRILKVDAGTGKLFPAAFQVLETAEWNDPDLVGREPYRYQPTRVADLVFLADVPARQKRVYLVCHGRPDAAPAAQPTDLQVRRGPEGVTVENEFYRVRLHGPSGMIDEVFVKQGCDVLLEHHHEREGTVHWNPDIWSPPRPWVHTNDWPDARKEHGPPGPVCFVAKAHDVFPEGVDEVEASVTYQFYARCPLILMSSAMHVKRPAAAKSLRNGEIVFNRQVLDHVAAREADGTLLQAPVDELWPHPMSHEGWHVSPDAPWLCFYGPRARVGFGQINLARMEYRWDTGLPRLGDPHYYVAVGPWVYLARALVYPWGSPNPSQTSVVPGGSQYLERIAWLPFRLGRHSGERFAPLDQWSVRLHRPLFARVHADIDPRTPEKFVNPAIRFPIQQTDDENVFQENP